MTNSSQTDDSEAEVEPDRDSPSRPNLDPEAESITGPEGDPTAAPPLDPSPLLRNDPEEITESDRLRDLALTGRPGAGPDDHRSALNPPGITRSPELTPRSSGDLPWRTSPLTGSPPAGPPERSEPPPQPAPSSGWGRTVLVAVSSGLLGGVLALVGFLVFDGASDPEPAPPAVTIIERVRTEVVTEGPGEVPAASVAREVIPSIVTVEVDSDGGSFVADGSGSGVVLDLEGHIVTNEHVVAGSRAVRVIFSDGRTYEAEVVGMDPLTDLAVLSIDAIDLVPIDMGTSDDLSIGDPAIAVGSPLGLEGGPSLTVGVISAFNRPVVTGNRPEDQLVGLLQTDAPITRGSSGGALVNRQGELIGITSAIGVSNVGAEGIGFAIPVELVRRVTDELITTGGIRHALLGVEGRTELEERSDGALVPVIVISSVTRDSGADLAGLEEGDHITAVDGQGLQTMDGLVSLIRRYRVGDTVDISLLRDGAAMTVTATLGERVT